MNVLITLILSLLGKKPTVETVLSSFVKAANTLDILQQQHAADIDKHNAAVEKLTAKIDTASSEIEAAAKAAANIRAIIGK